MSVPYTTRVARLNAAAAAALAMAPRTPDIWITAKTSSGSATDGGKGAAGATAKPAETAAATSPAPPRRLPMISRGKGYDAVLRWRRGGRGPEPQGLCGGDESRPRRRSGSRRFSSARLPSSRSRECRSTRPGSASRRSATTVPRAWWQLTCIRRERRWNIRPSSKSGSVGQAIAFCGLSLPALDRRQKPSCVLPARDFRRQLLSSQW